MEPLKCPVLKSRKCSWLGWPVIPYIELAIIGGMTRKIMALPKDWHLNNWPPLESCLGEMSMIDYRSNGIPPNCNLIHGLTTFSARMLKKYLFHLLFPSSHHVENNDFAVLIYLP